MAGFWVLVGSYAWAQDPLPMPGVPLPSELPVPAPVAPQPVGPVVPLGPPTTIDPNARSPEDTGLIDFVPAARPEADQSLFELEYSEAFVWSARRSTQDVTFVVISHRPNAPNHVLLGDSNGGVWLSTDGLISYRQTLGGDGLDDIEDALDFEDLLDNVDVEAAGDQAFGGQTDSEESDEADEAAFALQQALDDAASALEEELGDDVGTGGAPRLVWVEDILYASTTGGLFRSSDGGATFQKVARFQALDIVRTSLGLLAGTADGVRYSGNGFSWTDEEDGSEGVRMEALVSLSAGQALAATPLGLYHSADGFRWTLRARTDRPLRTIDLDPDIPGRVWVGTSANVLSSDDLGANFSTPLSAPLLGTTAMEHLGNLHWLAATRDGVWESLNGGLSWLPIVSGLTAPKVTSLSAMGGVIHCVAGGQVHTLQRSDRPSFSPAEKAKVVKEQMIGWVPRGLLLDSALNRRELTTPGPKKLAAYMLPRLTVSAGQAITDGVQYRSGLDLDEPLLEEDAGTIRRYKRVTTAQVLLQWTPPDRKGKLIAQSATDQLVLAADDADGSSNWKSIDYQSDLARRVSELHSQRIEVAAQRLEIGRQPLMQQVFLELAIQEIEADLDVYTNGAVAEWTRSHAPTSDARTPSGGFP